MTLWYYRTWALVPPATWASMILDKEYIERPTEQAALLRIMRQAEKAENLRALDATTALGSVTD